MEESVAHAEDVLRGRLGRDAQNVAALTSGEWARAFQFDEGDERLVLRLSDHAEDFRKDAVAARLAMEDLPIPAILETGALHQGYYAISRYAPGAILDTLSRDAWDRCATSLARAMAAIWSSTPPGSGWGGWNGDGVAALNSWREHLLSVAHDEPAHRLFGWSEKLRSRPDAFSAFTARLSLLNEVATDDVPRRVIHADLLGNVLVDDEKVSAVFDWGCGAYGDPIYDVAWFTFWDPWYQELDVRVLEDALDMADRSSSDNERMLACLLHIGLDHLAYNAALERWDALDKVVARIEALVKERSGPR